MEAFDPTEHAEKCERYLSMHLGSAVHLVHAELLPQSSRAAPWKLDVLVDGEPRSFVLQLDLRRGLHEFHALKAMENIPVPTPRAYGLDPDGEALGMACFFSGFLEGESLLSPLVAGETWALDLYLETVYNLQSITRQQLASAGELFSGEDSALDVLNAAQAYFLENPHPLAEAVYHRLKESMPPFPEVRFSNGDLWPDNFIVRDRELVGVIDFEGAGFSDPIYEFLLAFFVEPGLRGRGIEERYCARMGYDPAALPWYNALEYFDTWHHVRRSGESFVHYTDEYLQQGLMRWLESGKLQEAE